MSIMPLETTSRSRFWCSSPRGKQYDRSANQREVHSLGSLHAHFSVSGLTRWFMGSS